MPLSTLAINAVLFSGGVLQEGTPPGGEPYNLPPLTAIILLIVLITVLVLALAYNIRAYRPSEAIHHGEEPAGESLPEH